MKKAIIFVCLLVSVSSLVSAKPDKIFREVSAPLDVTKMNLEIAKANAEYRATLLRLGTPLNEADKATLLDWSLQSDDINDPLRAKVPDKRLLQEAAKLEKVMMKFPVYSGRVYRVAESDIFNDGTIKEGDVVLDKGYLASSSSAEYVKDFCPDGKTFFVIDPKSSAYSIAGVRSDQAEVLFRPKTPFKVKNIQIIKGKAYVHLEETEIPEGVPVKDIYTGEVHSDLGEGTPAGAACP